MDALRIEGGTRLVGDIRISGSKNASLPILAAALLADDKSILENVPDLADIRTMASLLQTLGARCERNLQNALTIDASTVNRHEAPYDLVRTMRASILVLGPLLARFGMARVSLPGGCAIGARPIDQHLKGLEKMGAEIQLRHGYVEAKCNRLRGAEIAFDVPTVGGTEQLMLAASLAEGVTVLSNAALEPEIVDLARALIAMGVEISGAGTQRIQIHGQNRLRGYQHKVAADRIEAGTFVVAGALLGEPLTVRGVDPTENTALLNKLTECGVEIRTGSDFVTVRRCARPKPVRVRTAPYPGFPTDTQAQLMALLALSQGTSVIVESIFENRFMHVAELCRLGAQIALDRNEAVITGVPQLSGTTVMATDLRASACLVLAGLVAQGETVIRRIYHLDRGYEYIAEKLQSVGAKISRFRE